MPLDSSAIAFAGTGGADEVEDRLDDPFADRRAPHDALRLEQVLCGHDRLRPPLALAGRLDQDAALGVAVGIADVDLQEEPVELRLRQRIGALLLERVLRRQHMERARQVVPDAGDGHMVLLHRLKQRRLGAGARAIDFVRHQELGEDRSADEAESPLAVVAFLHHLGAEDVGGHQVRRELHAAGVESDDDAERFDQLRLGEARNADQEAVTAREQHGQAQIDDAGLSHDDRADLGARRRDALENGRRCRGSTAPRWKRRPPFIR